MNHPIVKKNTSDPVSATINYQNFRILLSATALSILLGRCLSIQEAFAEPSITYTGTVTPTPPAGTKNWDWSPSQVLVVGSVESGALYVRGGATAKGDTILIGTNSFLGSGGAVTVDGYGSTITATHIYLGQSEFDNGTLTISDGGRVDVNSDDAGGLILGGAKAQVIVTGPGSSLNSNNRIYVGRFGEGDLTVTNGGKVTGYQLYLGNNTSSTGTVTIAGSDSSWTGQYGVWVGQFGKGTLNLSDGGSINDTTLQIAYDTATTGTVNIGGTYSGPAEAAGNINVDTIKFNSNGGGSIGTLNFNTTDGTTVRAEISGVGTINQIAGTTILTGDNKTYAGAMNITGGTLQLGNGGTSGNLAVDVSTGTDALHKGTLAFDRSDNVKFSNTISGTGSVSQMGAGTTTLAQDNSYSGGTIITGGTLSVSSDANLGAAAGGLALDGGTLQVTGSQYTSTDRTMTLGSHGGGFNITDAANGFTIAQVLSGTGAVWKLGDGALLLSGDNSFSGGLNVESGTVLAGISDHAFGSGVLTVAQGAKADLNNFNTVVGGLAGGGNAAMDTGDLTLICSFDAHFSGVISGSGTLTKIGSGTQTLSGANSYSGVTNVNGGTLKQGVQGTFNANSSGYNVGTRGVLDLGGFDTTIASLANGGTVKFGGLGGTVLRVSGNYTADSGTLVINTVLGDDNSKTDMLQVDGSTSGSGKIYVQNQGGTGAQTINGIKIVNVDGSSDGKFTLANSYTTKDGQQAVVGGAYAYTLQNGGDKTPTDGEWYLVSHMPDPVNPVDPDCAQTNSCPPAPPAPPAPRYSAGAPVYEGYVQNMLTLNKLPTLQQRVGNRYFAGGKLQGSDDAGQPDGASVNENGVWGRIEGSHNRLEPSTSTARMKQDINALQMQAGGDGQFYEGDNGRVIAGITGQYGHAKGDISSLYGEGSISTDAWSLGATATWYGNDGFYLDTQGQVTWFNSNLDSWTANQGLADGRKATGYALSAEAGKRIAIGGNWSLTPQAQLAWSSIHADAFRDVWNARVSVDDGSSLLGRLGLAAEYSTQWKDESGRITQANLYGITNLYQEFLSSTTVKLAGVDFNTDNDRTWAGVGGGGTFTWNDNKYALYGEGSINTAVNHFTENYSIRGAIGFKSRW